MNAVSISLVETHLLMLESLTGARWRLDQQVPPGQSIVQPPRQPGAQATYTINPDDLSACLSGVVRVPA